MAPGAGKQFNGLQGAEAEHHFKPLAERLDQKAMDHVFDKVPRSAAKQLEALDARSTSGKVEAIVAAISNQRSRDLVQTVFNLLLQGDEDGAQTHIDISMGRIAPLEDADRDDVLEVLDGEDIRRLKLGSVEYERWLEAFEKRTTWYEWFLFLHPEQEAVVKADYSGASQLSGVSGSGKTCVAVRRALRLAEEAGANVLLLTLNRSLAGLLKQLVDAACPNEEIRRRIKVTSFFELAQELLAEFEPENRRIYADVTWKLNEHVDWVFREYYRQWLNNDDASVLEPVHRSMTARGVSGEGYLREEFDWLRSAICPDERQQYLSVERRGRKFPIQAEWRSGILRGLEGWEAKMRHVGVIDYLGLTSALSRHVGNLEPRFSNILVDEAQDFGTTELQVIRKLVAPGKNDIFLCGDIAQTVLPKHRVLAEAGLHTLTRERIQKNYRNSREILKAAYEVLSNNLYDDLFDSTDLEILDPKFANFGGSTPMALAAENLEEEIAYARAFADSQKDARNVCIAFAGFSSRDINEFSAKCGVTSLDGAYDPNSDRLVFGDLEQTKGYEFDVLIILNCVEGVLPPRDAPPEEAHRAACKLYVAMTRAKRELVLSFHGKTSRWIADVRDTIGTAMWSEVEVFEPALMVGTPELLPETEPDKSSGSEASVTGREFLYTSSALGLTLEAQGKLVDVVDGRGLMASGGARRLKWRNVGNLLQDLSNSRRHDPVVRPAVSNELRELGKRLVAAD